MITVILVLTILNLFLTVFIAVALFMQADKDKLIHRLLDRND